MIFNALIIIALVPLALRGVRYRPLGAEALLRWNLLVYGVGGIVAPFIGIKIDRFDHHPYRLGMRRHEKILNDSLFYAKNGHGSRFWDRLPARRYGTGSDAVSKAGERRIDSGKAENCWIEFNRPAIY